MTDSGDDMLADLGLDDDAPPAKNAPKPAAKGRRAGTSILGSGGANYGSTPTTGRTSNPPQSKGPPALGGVSPKAGPSQSSLPSSTPQAQNVPSAQPKKRPTLDDDDDDDDDINFSFLSNPRGGRGAALPTPTPIAVPTERDAPSPATRQTRAPSTATRPQGGGAMKTLPEEVARLKEELRQAEERKLQADKEHEEEVKRKANETEAERVRARELEDKVTRLTVQATKLMEERRMQDEITTRVERDRDDMRREYEETRSQQQKTSQINTRLQQESDELDSLRKELKSLQTTHGQTLDDYSLEKRKNLDLQQAMADPSVLPYTPPPGAAAIAKNVPTDMPLSMQFQVMLHNCATEITSYQKVREEAMMQSMRIEQQRWMDEMQKREDLRHQIERQELTKWRVKDQEERLERERRDEEERLLRSQKDDRERTDRETQLREERQKQAQQELAEREVWGQRIHAEHQQTVERITLGYTTAQDQMMRAHEQQIKTSQTHSEEERKHHRKMTQQQMDDLAKKYEAVIKLQETQHRDTVSAMGQFGEALLKLTACETSLQNNMQQLSQVKQQWDSSFEAVNSDREAGIADREAILEEMRRAASEKQQHLESERIMLSRMFADFKVTVDGIKRQQDDERSRLVASVTRADKAREDYEREHRKWMRDCLRHKLDSDAEQNDSVNRVVEAVDDLKAERQSLTQERREFDRQREAHLRNLNDNEAKMAQQRDEAEGILREAAKKEDLAKEAASRIQTQLADLQRQEHDLAIEKEKLRDELYRVKDLGNMAYQKSKDLQKVRDEIRSAADQVEARAAADEADKANHLEAERASLAKQRTELDRARKDLLLDAATRRHKALHDDPMAGVNTIQQAPRQEPAHTQQRQQQGQLKEILEQEHYLRSNVMSAGASAAVVSHAQQQQHTPATHQPTPKAPTTDASPAASRQTSGLGVEGMMESLMGQQWVSLLRLSEDGYEHFLFFRFFFG